MSFNWPLSPNWHFPQLALFWTFFCAIENLSPPTAGTPSIFRSDPFLSDSVTKRPIFKVIDLEVTHLVTLFEVINFRSDRFRIEQYFEVTHFKRICINETHFRSKAFSKWLFLKHKITSKNQIYYLISGCQSRKFHFK